MKTIVNISRIILGLVFVVSSLAKAIDPVGTAMIFQQYLHILFNLHLAFTLSLPLTIFLIIFEFTLGAMMLTKYFYKFAVWLIFLTLIIFTLASLFFLIFKPEMNCACYGNLLYVDFKWAFVKNLFLLFLALLTVLKINEVSESRVPKRYQLSWILTFALFIFFFEFYNYAFLPIIDKSPVKDNTNLKSLIDNPKQLKNKKQQEIIAHFRIINSQGKDITDSILSIKQPVLLIFADNLKYLNVKGFIKVLKFSRDFMDRYYPIAFCLTASPKAQIDTFKNLTGAYELYFLKSDSWAMREILRTQPGIIILYNGIVVKKRSYYNLPKIKNLEKFFNNYLNEKAQE